MQPRALDAVVEDGKEGFGRGARAPSQDGVVAAERAMSAGTKSAAGTS